jgi:hypothetical protein
LPEKDSRGVPSNQHDAIFWLAPCSAKSAVKESQKWL